MIFYLILSVITAEAAANGGGVGSVGVLTEEAIQKATQDFETKMRAIMIQQQKVASQQGSYCDHLNIYNPYCV